MLKKLLIASLTCLASVCLTPAFAGASFYLAPSAVYQDIMGGGAQYSGLNLRPAIGFGGLFRDSLYLAGEIYIDPRSITIRNSMGDNGLNIKEKYGYGATIIPGYDLDGTLMLYGRLGIAYADFEALNATRSGYLVGGGVEYRMDGSWSARGEYIYIGYSSIEGTRPRDQEIGVGLVYRFTQI